MSTPETGGSGEVRSELTGSAVATKILEDWGRSSAAFWRVAPRAEVAAIEQAHEGTA